MAINFEDAETTRNEYTKRTLEAMAKIAEDDSKTVEERASAAKVVAMINRDLLMAQVVSNSVAEQSDTQDKLIKQIDKLNPDREP